MNLTRIYAIFIRQTYLLRTNAARLMQIFLWAALDIFLWGFISRYLNGVGNAGFSFVPVLLGAVLLWDFLVRVQQGVTMPFLEDIWSRNLLNLFASPLTIAEYITGFVLTSIVTSLAGLIAMLLLAGIFFGLSLAQFGLYVVPFLATLFLFGVSLGVLGAAFVLRYGPAAEWFTWPIPAILGPFVGVFYPISVLPVWMQNVSHILPPTYVFEGLRAALAGTAFSWSHAILGLALACTYILLSYGFFMFIYRSVVRNGLIARFSAEVV